MHEITTSLHVPKIELPSTAPQIRITAGMGSVAQKTWNLRRPVTLIGSRRPAHIVLHDRDISPAHCVIVNTGMDVLLKDLYTSSGTLCNDAGVDLRVLRDGDVITVGTNRIQMAIQVPQRMSDDPDAESDPVDPTVIRTPVDITLIHTDQQWSVERPVALIGRHESADILLDDERVSRRHAIFFRFMDGLAVFDIGGENGILVNGKCCPQALLSEGDRITVGPFGLQLGFEDPGQDGWSMPTPDASAVPELTLDPSNDCRTLESQLDALRNNITQSWERLSSWHSQLLDNAGALSRQEADMATRESGLDTRDAMLQGQLHDVSRHHEQLTERRQELGALVSRLQAQEEQLAQDQEECADREAEIARHAEELSHREHVLAQRASRLPAAVCPHCGRPAEVREVTGNPPLP